MERFDHEQVRKIWQRVQSGAAYTPEEAVHSIVHTDLRAGELISQAQMEKVLFLQLSQHFSGKNREILHKMAKQKQSHSAILRGICTITESALPAIPGPKLKPASTAVLLRRCYGHCLQSLSEYKLHANDPQYGSAFQKMAEQEQQHCQILLALLGSLKHP